ncbi:MAG: hypothetical protein H0U50_00980 [Pyrinomonadaceae bacterium]|nr:hypothetical protein [Pyrinomonadaceae bacterium]
MTKFDNPLNNIKIASPCSADWNAMMGNERKRYCGDCKLNVYNLSGMTRTEAENLLLNSEGRLCVRFYKRADGTVLTKDCPVGWQALKKRISKKAAAVFSMIAGILGGLFAFNATKLEINPTMGAMIKINPDEKITPIIIKPLPTAETEKIEMEQKGEVLTEYVGMRVTPIEKHIPKKAKRK